MRLFLLATAAMTFLSMPRLGGDAGGRAGRHPVRPIAVLGQQTRDAFTLALKQLGGKLGGLDTHLTVVDDELKPDVALTKVRTLLDREHPTFVVGPIFSNVLGAIVKR